ncbi:hypothetical protein Desmer_3022 [Desulfosporosinus meridiei DSM 13257]|uniref:Uncharacterized protein n=1 Tax=Desulfosporosinus meridiei (strain ATCC BAA-275 / DSM 13257 / KCTC 12902 / NCIMB 13706 / S10) TaxID=768704 RepID=J7J1S6_DESMD|nr:hypothetical protein Desmer_3022 [Desulfosporosinus meridiei DSM 13257]
MPYGFAKGFGRPPPFFERMAAGYHEGKVTVGQGRDLGLE